jgi:arylsulfatase A-like enzyme
VNVLLVTLDQFRADCLSAAGHPVLRTPHLDRLASEGVRLANHFSQAAPCGPGRASLYTGMYQANHRVVANGTPLDQRFDNVAWAARRAGFVPTLFGYTDQSIDPREADGPHDPRLFSYEGVLPGFEADPGWSHGHPTAWIEWLRELGHTVSDDPEITLAGEPDRPAEHSLATHLTDAFLEWLDHQDGAWFAHLSLLRPHPPYAAAGHYAQRYDPAEVPLPIDAAADTHPLHAALMRHPDLQVPADAAGVRQLRAQYYGMISEVDDHLGRVWAALEAAGQWDNTLVVVTSDHGEQLGDHGLVQKAGYFDGSYSIVGIVRDPRFPDAHGTVVDRFTENVDVMPTLCEAMGLPVPLQCDGLPLTPFLQGVEPPWWREAAHWEWDWRFAFIPHGPHDWPWNRQLEQQTLVVHRTRDLAYVHFGDGSWRCFDLAADPTWRTLVTDPAAVLGAAQELLTWRSEVADRMMTGLLVEDGGIGRWPPLPEDWHRRDPA